jgi:hypothetical protein
MATPTIEELLARLEEQQARIERLESGPAPAASPGAGEPAEPGPHHGGMTRRGMVTTAAVGTAGLVGAILAESGGVASAATGPGTFTSNSATPAVKATNTAKGYGVQATAGSAAAVRANQTGTAAKDVAVFGVINNSTGTGTGVKGTSPKGAGVAGVSTSGSGMAGSSTSGTGVTGSSGTGAGVAGSSGTGTGVTGASGSTVGGAVAVLGTITSTSPGGSSAGVFGQNNGTGGSGIGVYGAQNGFGWGVYGTTPSGIGVYGYCGAGTGVQGGSFSGPGVYASSSSGIAVNATSDSNTGVLGTSHSGTAVQGNSTSGYGVYGGSPSNYAVVGVTTSGNAVYGQTSTAPQAGVVGRTLDSSGNWAIYGFGNIGASGTKSAVVPAADGRGHVTLYCMESPECWFEDFGSARLAGGSATVKIDPEFAQTIHTGEYHVFLQAEGECRGLAVLDKAATGFVVRELGGGASNVPFAYRIVALRKDVSAPRLNRVTLPEAAPQAPPSATHRPAPPPARQVR